MGTFAPGQTLTAQDQKVVDRAGKCEFWPCYTLPDHSACPDEWVPFFVDVGESE
jgi:hypothetical protein